MSIISVKSIFPCKNLLYYTLYSSESSLNWCKTVQVMLNSLKFGHTLSLLLSFILHKNLFKSKKYFFNISGMKHFHKTNGKFSIVCDVQFSVVLDSFLQKLIISILSKLSSHSWLCKCVVTSFSSQIHYYNVAISVLETNFMLYFQYATFFLLLTDRCL